MDDLRALTFVLFLWIKCLLLFDRILWLNVSDYIQMKLWASEWLEWLTDWLWITCLSPSKVWILPRTLNSFMWGSYPALFRSTLVPACAWNNAQKRTFPFSFYPSPFFPCPSPFSFPLPLFQCPSPFFLFIPPTFSYLLPFFF